MVSLFGSPPGGFASAWAGRSGYPSVYGFTPSSGGIHSRWGVSLLAAEYSAVGLAEIEMSAEPGGATLCVGGTPTASSTNAGAGPVTTLFDGLSSTEWGGLTGTCEWVEYEFTSPVAIGEVRLRARDDIPLQAPRAYVVWGRDASGGTRIPYAIATGGTAWTASEWRSLAVPTTPLDTGRDNARIWMLDFSESNGGLTILQEMIFANSIGGATICVGGSAGATSSFGNSFVPSRAVDGGANEWAGNAPPQKLLYVFPTAVNPVQYRLQARASGGGDAPKAWTLNWSVNGVDFTTTDTVTAQTGWTGSQTRSFNIT